MKSIRRLSIAEQVAEHLREGLRQGRWGSALPGVLRLAAELDVSAKTMRVALRQLETDGLLDPQGWGRSRRITRVAVNRQCLRVGLLPFEPMTTAQSITAQLLLTIQQALEAAGHEFFLSKPTQMELCHNVPQITRQVLKARADAWIVESGSHELLKWFAGQPTPCLALYGNNQGLSLARTGPDSVSPTIMAMRHLLQLGHRQIVMIVRRAQREPTPSIFVRTFLTELAGHGISAGRYHLPDWEETPLGLNALLDQLFRVTPPTALIIDESPQLIAAVQFLAQRGFKVPQHVSLISTEHDSSLAWCHPNFAHFYWRKERIVQRIVRWVAAVRRGNPDRLTINFPSQFILGGTVGPPPGGSARPATRAKLG